MPPQIGKVTQTRAPSRADKNDRPPPNVRRPANQSMPVRSVMAVGDGWGEQPDLVVVGVEAVDLQVLGRGVFLVADVDRHVGVQLDLRDLLALAVVEVGRDPW